MQQTKGLKLMRRLVGLIALAALIYAAVWMIQNDFDLRKIPILSLSLIHI